MSLPVRVKLISIKDGDGVCMRIATLNAEESGPWCPSARPPLYWCLQLIPGAGVMMTPCRMHRPKPKLKRTEALRNASAGSSPTIQPAGRSWDTTEDGTAALAEGSPRTMTGRQIAKINGQGRGVRPCPSVVEPACECARRSGTV